MDLRGRIERCLRGRAYEHHFVADSQPEGDVDRRNRHDPEQAAPDAALRVLLVDDNEDAVRGLEKLLQLLGFEVVGTCHGREALKVGATFRPHVVVLDLGMPDMNGYEVADRIRATEWGEHARLVALTGWGQPEDIRRSMDAGFEAHLLKPLKTQELLALLGRSVS